MATTLRSRSSSAGFCRALGGYRRHARRNSRPGSASRRRPTARVDVVLTVQRWTVRTIPTLPGKAKRDRDMRRAGLSRVVVAELENHCRHDEQESCDTDDESRTGRLGDEQPGQDQRQPGEPKHVTEDEPSAGAHTHGETAGEHLILNQV